MNDAYNACAKTLTLMFGTRLAWWMRRKPKSQTTLRGPSSVSTIQKIMGFFSFRNSERLYVIILSRKLLKKPLTSRCCMIGKRKGSHFGLPVDPFASCGDDSAISSSFHPIHPRALRKLHSRTAIPWAFLSKPSDVISRCCTCVLAFASITVTAALVVPLPGLSA